MNTPPLTPNRLDWNAYLRSTLRRGCSLIPTATREVRALYASTEAGALPRGYTFPEAWLNENLTEFRGRLNAHVAWKLYFQVAEWMTAARRAQQRKAGGHKPPGGTDLIWHFLPVYFRLLYRPRGRAALLPYRLSPGPLAEKSCLQQVLEMLLLRARTQARSGDTVADYEAALQTASAPVRAFFAAHFERIYEDLSAYVISDDPPPPFTEDEEVTQAFYELVEEDEDNLYIGSVLPRMEADLPPALTAALSEARRTRSAGKDLFARITAYTPPTPASSTPPAPATAPDFTLEEVRNLPAEMKAELLAAATKTEPRAAVLTAHRTALLNALLAPYLTYRSAAEPERYVAPDQVQPELLEEYSERLDLEARELETLRKRMVLLENARSITALDSVAAGGVFTTREARERWAAAVDRRRVAFSEDDRWRGDKLREYGMDEVDLEDRELKAYLDELLRIEREVAPYVGYVRQAFQAVLPISNSPKLDPYRHSLDGAEFDPETLSQPEKYLRGEVMRPFLDRAATTPIVQVNALCLDYSKSMTHGPMRDLFKLVYLLVLGLEGRRTYDAIHFFGDDFVRAVDFSDKHTSRAVLFTVLYMISRVEGYSVKYGGEGYTNISAGVEASHRQVNRFAEQLQRKNNDIQLVKSLFVLTDGEPTGGIFKPSDLRDYIQGLRETGDVVIKGIYLNTGDDVGEVVSGIFGKENTVESAKFEDAIVAFTQLMARTYKAQRKAFREEKLRKRFNSVPHDG